MLIELKLNDQSGPDGVNSASPSFMIKSLGVCKHKHYQFCTEGRQRKLHHEFCTSGISLYGLHVAKRLQKVLITRLKHSWKM